MDELMYETLAAIERQVKDELPRVPQPPIPNGGPRSRWRVLQQAHERHVLASILQHLKEHP